MLQTEPKSIIKSSTGTGWSAVGDSKSPSSKTSSTSKWSLAFFAALWSKKELELNSTVSIKLEPTSSVSTLASSTVKFLLACSVWTGMACLVSASCFFSVNLALISAVETIALGLLSEGGPDLVSLGFSWLKKTTHHRKEYNIITPRYNSLYSWRSHVKPFSKLLNSIMILTWLPVLRQDSFFSPLKRSYRVDGLKSSIVFTLCYWPLLMIPTESNFCEGGQGGLNLPTPMPFSPTSWFFTHTSLPFP